MSSRNQRLSAEERDRATVLIDALRQAKIAFKKGERDSPTLIDIVQKRVAEESMARLDYVAIVDRATMQPIDKVGDREALILIAANFGDVRLIDNVILNRKQ
jgi:pantothenate synthetase